MAQLDERKKEEQPEQLLERFVLARDPELRDRLVGHYLYIADIVARRFSGRGVEYDDLYQVAALALMRALERFDPGRGIKFQTFATPTLIGEVRNYFRDKSRAIRVPRRSLEGIKRLNQAREELSASLMRTPTPDELASYMRLTADEVLELIEESVNMAPVSLDAALSGESTLSLERMLGSYDIRFEQVDARDFLERALDTLSDMERSVIMKRYFEQRSQQEVAKSMNVSQMYISRLEHKILAKLRELL